MYNRTFEEFVADEPSLQAALAKARQFASNIKADPFGEGYCLTLAGQSGVGKSLLCQMVLADLKLNAWGRCEAIPRLINAGRIQDFTARFFDMRKVSDGFKEGRYGVVEHMESQSLTVLDDMGADHDPSHVAASKVDRVLRSRGRKWTLVTVNLSLQEIAEQLDGRIASFLIRDANRYIEIETDDFAARKFRQITT